jgi:hypothetical protein
MSTMTTFASDVARRYGRTRAALLSPNLKTTRMAVTKLPTSRWWNRGSPEPAKSTGGEPVQSTVVPLVKTTDATPVATPPATPSSPPPSTPPQFAPAYVPGSVRDFAPEIVPGLPLLVLPDLVPLTILTNGDTAMVANGLGNREWTNEDFAREFLLWVAREYPPCAGKKISVGDIDTFFLPRFQIKTGRIHLALGALLRGLGKVTEKIERTYTDWSGLQRELVEYRVPKVRRS